MTWAELHAKSESLAIEASLAQRNRDALSAQELFRQAARFEKNALDALDSSKVRTRGITAVSTVALWFKSGEYVQAELVAHSALSDVTIPEFARQELRNLVQAIWTETTKQTAGVEFVPGQVLVSVKGGEVVTGGAPLDLIVDKVQTIQAMFYRTIEFLNGVSHRRVGRPTKELQESCRPWLFQSVPGSYQFSVGIQKPAQSDFFKADVEPERIAQHFLEIVGASATDDDGESLEKLVPDEAYRNTFLKLARNLAPTGKSFDRIELTASGDSRPIALSMESRKSINQRLNSKTSEAGESPQEVTDLRGVLRAVHLDKDWLEVAVDGSHVLVNGLEDAVDDIIGPMVNRAVVVKAIAHGRKYKYVDIELAE
jgi:hypothetical protein